MTKPLNGDGALLQWVQRNKKTVMSLTSVEEWQVDCAHIYILSHPTTDRFLLQAVVNHKTWTNLLTESERESLKVEDVLFDNEQINFWPFAKWLSHDNCIYDRRPT